MENTIGLAQVGRAEDEARAAAAEVAREAGEEVSGSVQVQVRSKLPAIQPAASLGGGHSNLCGGSHSCFNLWQTLA